MTTVPIGSAFITKAIENIIFCAKTAELNKQRNLRKQRINLRSQIILYCPFHNHDKGCDDATRNFLAHKVARPYQYLIKTIVTRLENYQTTW